MRHKVLKKERKEKILAILWYIRKEVGYNKRNDGLFCLLCFVAMHRTEPSTEF